MTSTFENLWDRDGKHCPPKGEKVGSGITDWCFIIPDLDCFSEFQSYISYICHIKIKVHLDVVKQMSSGRVQFRVASICAMPHFFFINNSLYSLGFSRDTESLGIGSCNCGG